jgi:hypothetical protein
MLSAGSIALHYLPAFHEITPCVPQGLAQNGCAMAQSERLVPPVAPSEAELFGDYSPAVTLASAVILVLAIGVIDRLTGDDVYVSILYLVPIAMVTWALGRGWGFALCAAVMALWIGLHLAVQGHGTAFYWNVLLLAGTFFTVALLLARLREAVQAHEVSASMIEKMDAPAYVVNLQRDLIVFGNREFRAAFAGRSAEELAPRPARESRFHLADGTPAVLRVLL